MGLFDKQTSAQLKARKVKSRIDHAYRTLTDALRQSVNDIYGDPRETQDVLNAFGTQASVIFGLSNIGVEAINSAVALTGQGEIITNVIPPEHSVTINPDGTATDIYSPPTTSITPDEQIESD